MEKAEQHIQSEYICNASILINWNDIRNADMSKLYAIVGKRVIKEKDIFEKEMKCFTGS